MHPDASLPPDVMVPMEVWYQVLAAGPPTSLRLRLLCSLLCDLRLSLFFQQRHRFCVRSLLRRLEQRACCCYLHQIGPVLCLLWPHLCLQQKGLVRVVVKQLPLSQQKVMRERGWLFYHCAVSCAGCRQKRQGKLRFHELSEISLCTNAVLWALKQEDKQLYQDAVVMFLGFVQQQRVKQRCRTESRFWSSLQQWYRCLLQMDDCLARKCAETFGTYFD